MEIISIYDYKGFMSNKLIISSKTCPLLELVILRFSINIVAYFWRRGMSVDMQLLSVTLMPHLHARGS